MLFMRLTELSKLNKFWIGIVIGNDANGNLIINYFWWQFISLGNLVSLYVISKNKLDLNTSFLNLISVLCLDTLGHVSIFLQIVF